MARKKEEPKPLYPLHHEHADALQNVLQQAGMLLTTVEILNDHPEAMSKPEIRTKLKERTDALRKALYGDEWKAG